MQTPTKKSLCGGCGIIFKLKIRFAFTWTLSLGMTNTKVMYSGYFDGQEDISYLKRLEESRVELEKRSQALQWFQNVTSTM